MKICIWAYEVALALTVFFVQGLCAEFRGFYHWFLGNKPLPAATMMILDLHPWFYVIPAVWLVGACVITFSKNATMECGLVFAGTSTLLIIAIAGISALALILPLMPAC